MNQKLTAAIGAVLITAGLATASWAVQLQTMLQGYLTNTSGTPFTGPQAAEFKVYQGGSPTTAGSGTLAYDETATVTPAASGVFNYMLGSGTPVSPVLLVGGQAVANVISTATFDTMQAIYVEISVGGTVLLPRLQLLGMPFSAISGVAESLKPVNQLTTNGLLASSGTFTASGPATFSIQTSSGINVGGGGGVTAAFFNGTFYGSGAGLTGVAASNVAAGNVMPGTFQAGVQLPAAQVATGALTVTSGTFTASGAQASIQTSSGILVQAGLVTAPGFSGTYYGDGSHLSGVGASNVAAANVTPGAFATGVLLPAAQVAAGALTVTSGTFTASGAQASIQTSSGILVQAGLVTAPGFSGTYYGDGSHLNGVIASGVAAPNVTPGTLGAGVLLPAAQLSAGPVTATSGTFTASGAQVSIQTSSGILVQAGLVTAPGFSGTYYGDGSHLSGVSASNVAAANVTPGTFGGGVLLPSAQLVSGPITATSGTFATVGASPLQASAGGIGLYVDGSNNLGIKTQTPHADLEIGPVADAALRIGGIYSGPTSGYAGNGLETSRHQLVFPSWSAVANNTLGSKIVSINKTAYGSPPWYLSQTAELHFFLLKSGALSADDTVDVLQLTPGGLTASDGFFTPKGITAGSGTFTATGGQASIQTSSGILVQAGLVTAPGFSGTYYGDGSHLSGVNASNVAAADVTPGTFGAGVLLPAVQLALGPVTATSGTFTASGVQASIQTSSGILVQAGAVVAPFFSGNGSGLTGITASNVAAGNVTPGTFQLGVQLPASQVASGALTVTSGTFTASGPGQYSLQTSSGISVGGGGGVSAAFFNGVFYGSGAGLTGVAASNVAANNVTPGTLSPGVFLVAQNLLPGPVTATSGTFTASGSSQYSVQTASGISVGGGGGVTAAFFNGNHYGNGAGLTGVIAASVPAGSVTPGTFGPGVLLPTQNLLPGPINVTSGTFTAAGAAQYSIQTSSGINVGGGGGVNAASFSGAFYGNGAGLTGVGGASPIGSIIAFAGQTEPSGWIECNGRSLSQAGNATASWGQFNSAAVFAVIGTVWGSAGAGQYNIPDLRGIFPRGWNHGKSSGQYDPDAASRVAQYASGSTGDNIGSYQGDLVRGHYHVEGSFASGPLSGGSGGYYPYPQNPNTGNVVDAPVTGNMESRPRNASVMYILRVL